MVKMELFTAIDAADGDLSVFLFRSDNGKDIGYTVLPYSDRSKGILLSDMQEKYVHWFNDPESPRRNDMIKPSLLSEKIFDE